MTIRPGSGSIAAVNLGNTDWPSALIASIALVVSIVALARTIRRDRSAQAQQVSAWVSYHEPDELLVSSRAGAPCLIVANQSSRPIYDWHVEYFYRGDLIGQTRVRKTVPGGGRDIVTLNGETQAAFRERQGQGRGEPDRAFSDIVAAVAFRDAGGRRWKRDAVGSLARDRS
ncbi:hypothetical protein [Aeromicrobium sp.]|uniref:hypothetical protein n=1 Tax=Aeromicrobium sp. TaxID=1871063 RepID=UPI0025BE55B9|nr:hypothetical protein [Aeromicrobium sp.]MCK5890497.1 hypothetical protein [Aeromicrobium sp.]